jgi:cytosine/adenosine deaminase-related metal-dependent hydrolase
MKGKLLIKGGTVLSLDRAVGNVVGADVLIEDGIIREVRPSIRARGARVIDASDTIVMPGFVDAHRHLWRSLTRDLVADCGAELAADLTPDDVYAATLVGLLRALEAGITTVVDWCDVADDAAHLEAAATAHAESGLRTVLVRCDPELALTTDRTTEITSASASPVLVEAELDAVSAHWASARARGLRIHARAGTDASTPGVVAELGRLGLLGPDVTLSGCTNLSDADVDAIAASSTAAVITPTCDVVPGSAAPSAARRLLDRGIRPGVGTGDAHCTPGDMFVHMRTVMSMDHARTFERKLAGDAGAQQLLSTRDVIRLVTLDGAMAVGLGHITGSLTPGKRADVIVLRGDRPNIAPVNDPIGAVVCGMDTSNVDWVFVGGTSLVEHGALTADVVRARTFAEEARRHVTGAAARLADAGATPR